MNFYSLWLMTCNITAIVPKLDGHGKKIFLYKLFVKRNDEMEWYVTATFDKIEQFRNYAVRYVREVVNLPFPERNFLSYIPVLGKYYSDENNDVLIEKKYILDNFFIEMLKIQQVYKLDEFKKFFTEN
jgi:hypothetical protein